MAKYDALLIMRAIEELKEECAESQKMCDCKWNGAECPKCHYYIAIKALEKQIPKKPKDFYCPVCSHYFGDGDERNYCPCCGQKSDWSDADKDD